MLRMIDTLCAHYGCSVVLCTATQPAFDSRQLKQGLPLEGRELAPDPDRLSHGASTVTAEPSSIGIDSATSCTAGGRGLIAVTAGVCVFSGPAVTGVNATVTAAPTATAARQSIRS